MGDEDKLSKPGHSAEAQVVPDGKLGMIINSFLIRWIAVAVALLAALTAGGCATLSASNNISESLDLVERQTGHRPAWEAPWDNAPPPWDGHSTLQVDEAVALALRNNRKLRADLEMIGQFNADLVQAGLLQNPRFNFMAMLPDGGGKSMLRSSGFPLQALHELWLIPARKEAATAQLQEAVLRVADRAVETVAEVKRVYARAQYAQRAVELLRENMEIVERGRQLVESQQSAGKATLVESNVPRIRHLRLQSELVAMEAEYATTKRQLLKLMGFASASDAWRVTEIEESGKSIEPVPSEEELLKVAEESRLDLQAAQWTVGAAHDRIEVMRREGWPEVMVGLGFERAPAPPSQNPGIAGNFGNAIAGGLQTGAIEPAPFMPFGPKPREVDWTIGPMIDFELPIFDHNQAQVARAIHEFRQRWAEYEELWQTVASEVRMSKVMYDQNQRQLELFRDSILPEVNRNLEVARQSYSAGREQLTIFLQIQEDQIMTRLTALGFQRDLLLNRAELERQIGGKLALPSEESDIDESEVNSP